MSSAISYEYYKKQFSNEENGITAEGGFYITLLNNTGAPSVKGSLVTASSTANSAKLTPSSGSNAIGVVYEDGIAVGAPMKVVISGKAQVLLKDGESSTSGYWCGVSSVDGRIYQLSSIPILSLLDFSKGIGYALENKSSGTNVLAMVSLRFN